MTTDSCGCYSAVAFISLFEGEELLYMCELSISRAILCTKPTILCTKPGFFMYKTYVQNTLFLCTKQVFLCTNPVVLCTNPDFYVQSGSTKKLILCTNPSFFCTKTIFDEQFRIFMYKKNKSVFSRKSKM